MRKAFTAVVLVAAVATERLRCIAAARRRRTSSRSRATRR